MKSFAEDIKEGIPNELPEFPIFEKGINRAPERKEILSAEEKQLAVQNALRYFPKKFHSDL
ncbi:MAG: hypothetical protein ACKO8Q_00280, partial [Bacteroidota bacterium]